MSNRRWHPDWLGVFWADRYFDEIEKARSKYSTSGLSILTGVEIGNPHDYPQEVDRFLEKYPFDIMLASLHWMNGINIHLVESFCGRDANYVYSEYFKEIGLMARTCKFDVLAHFDRIFKLSLPKKSASRM